MGQKRSPGGALGWLFAGSLAAIPGLPAFASEGAEEEMVVTGSYIRGTPEDAEIPVDVIGREELVQQGNPSLIEMVRNLNITSGNLGETNQFDGRGGQGNEGAITINLRGLGASRTLVLLNGRRHVATEGQGVDIAAMPAAALARTEVLKDGAAALYGSDAIAGVVNLISRKGFEGVELRASQQFIRDSKNHGDQEFNLIYGWANDSFNFFVAGEYAERGELRARDRDWAVRPQPENPQGGFSGISNPAQIFPANPTVAGPLQGGTIAGAGRADPQCANLGGAPVGTSCQFQFTFFDNLVEPQETYKLYTEGNYTFADVHELHVEFLYSEMDMLDWKTSPSYPPQSLFGPDRFIPVDHPGLLDMRAQTGLPQFGTAGQGAFAVARYLGPTGFLGGPQTGTRETDVIRYGAELSGVLFQDSVDYSVSVNYSKRERALSGFDMFVERMGLAIDGWGGPNCDTANGTRGQGGCEFYNPFSNAIEQSVINGNRNPLFNPAVRNSDELVQWLVGKLESEATNELLVADLVLSGETPWSLPGGPVSVAGGLQLRQEDYQLTLNDITNIEKTPCQFYNPRSIQLGHTATIGDNSCTGRTGPFAFLSGTTEREHDRAVWGGFVELDIPITESLNVSASARYEDLDEAGTTFDPKIAFRWQALDWLALRGSASTTFRAPALSSLSGRGTALIFIAPASAFKAVDVIGNPNLEPEEAVATNVGFIVDAGPFYGSVDWWRFDFDSPFQTENSSQIVSAYITNGCQDGGAGAPLVAGVPTPSADCVGLRSHVFPTGTTAAALQRVDTNVINGGSQKTSGIDAFAQWDFQVDDWELSFGAQGTYTLEFESDDFLDINGFRLAQGGDFVGKLNDTTPFTPKPELKGNVFARWSMGIHNVGWYVRYTSEYDDPFPPLPAFEDVDQFVTHDVVYNVRVLDDAAQLSVSVFNLFDDDPPKSSNDLNYDPYTHNPLGRMIKLQATYTFGDG